MPLGSPLCYGVQTIFPMSCPSGCQRGEAELPSCLACLPGPGGDLQPPLCMLLRPYTQGRGLSTLSAWKTEGTEMKNKGVKIKE